MMWTDCPEDSCLGLCIDKVERKSERTREGDQKCQKRAKVSQGNDYQPFTFSVVVMC